MVTTSPSTRSWTRWPGPDLTFGDGVVAGLEGDQGVLADPPQVLLGDQIWLLRERQKRRAVGLRADADDLAVGAVDPGAADRQPGGEGAVELGDRVEGPAGDHVVADDVDLPLDPSLAGGAVGGQHVNGEPVVLGERRCFGGAAGPRGRVRRAA